MTKLLFFDDTHLIEKVNLNRGIGQPEPVPEGTFQDPNSGADFGYPIVFPNEQTGGWRMLYQALMPLDAPQRPRHFVPVVLDSDDGITWRIPDLTETLPIAERVLPNQVQPATLDRFGEWGPCYYDHRAPDPEQRIKGFVCKGHGPGTGIKDSWIVVSPDGLTWRDLNGKLWHPYGSDPAVCAFWNHYRDSYVLIVRPNNGDRRIAVMETPDWDRFSKVELALSADALDPDMAEIYGMPTFPYGDLFIGLVWLFQVTPTSRQHGKFLGGRINCQLAYSYDGWHFQRGLRDEFIGNLPPGQYGAGCIFPTSMIKADDEIRFYSCATRMEHAIFEGGPATAAILLHRLRLDGFVYLETSGGSASLKTRALLVEGDNLSLHVQVPDGEVTIEITDADGKQIDGYTFDDCLPCRADDVAWSPMWRSGKRFGALKDQAVQLELRIQGGRLYAINGDFQKLTAKEGMRYMRFGTPPDPKMWG
jgi:hypothetical protein